MCSGSFGILDDELLLECPTVECGAQYCRKCIESIQGIPKKQVVTCLSCWKDVDPQRNLLIEKHLIWPNISKLYGMKNILDFQRTSKFLSCRTILKDIEFRRIHLQSRLDTFQNKLQRETAVSLQDECLINNVKTLYCDTEQLANQLKDIDRTMQHHDIDLQDISNKHKKSLKGFDHLCHRLMSLIEALRMNEGDLGMEEYDRDREKMDNSYKKNRLENLSIDQNVRSIDQSLRDLHSRKQLLTYQLKTIQRIFPSKDSLEQDFKETLVKSNCTLEKIDGLMEKLNCVRGNLRAIERCTDEYVALLSEGRQADIPGFRLIYLLELLRTQTEKLEVVQNFPNTLRLMHEWQNDYGTEDDFKPKILDLCETIETDVEELFHDQKCMYSIAYRIGVVGNTSVGKSALIMALSNITRFSSMVNLERSTFGYLQFDSFFQDKSSDAKKIPISFIDIAGATDHDNTRNIGNYIDLITKADCDLYMIVFDESFDRQNQSWLDHIETTLGRQCLLVRSKVDLLFHQFYREESGRRFQNTCHKKCDVRYALEKTRQHSLRNYEQQLQERQVFCTAVVQDQDLRDIPFGRFDLDKLRWELCRSAMTDPSLARVSRLLILASRAVLNTCFRRGYIISKTKYRLLAAGGSLIPFLDEVPAFLGREKIRQAFGIHDRSTISNTFQGAKNSLEDYLAGHQFTVPTDQLKSGYFKYLTPKADKPLVMRNGIGPSQSMQSTHENYNENTSSLSQQRRSNANLPGANIAGGGLAVAGVIGKGLDGVVRITFPAVSGAVRGFSIVGIVLGAILSPIFAAWSFYSSGKRMNRHLHLLCDDLQIILVYLIIHMCSQRCENVSLPSPIPLDENSSPSDENDDDDV